MAQPPPSPEPQETDATRRPELWIAIETEVLAEEGETREFKGITNAVGDSTVELTIGSRTRSSLVSSPGDWRILWPSELPVGVYQATVRVTERAGSSAITVTHVQVRSERGPPRRPLVRDPPAATTRESNEDDFEAMTDRWKISPPPYELNVEGSKWDPYHQNRWKGDYPIKAGSELFLNLTARSDTLVDAFSVPTPAGVSTERAGGQNFFGQPSQLLVQQNVLLSADLFKGDTAFKPIDWRFRIALIGNANYFDVAELAAVKPDVRDGTHRTTGVVAVQELFFEYKLADLSPNYDFLSLRLGIQPFSSDFRGFLFNDQNLGLRLFGSTASNRNQFNVAFFERLEKDTNSGLNRLELRHQQVAIANLYRQDLFVEGYTGQASVHWVRDEASLFYDRNGFLARPDPIGSYTPHQVEATYLGLAGTGHFRRINIDHALYYAFGEDSLNPIAGRDPITLEEKSDISGVMAAIELSVDRNWYRPRVSYFYASGDSNIEDRDAEGFDAIFDAPNFAGGGFSFWNRLGVRLAGTGVSLVSRGSLLPDLSSSRNEGQINFVNPGIHIATLGLDLELTPKIKTILNANYLRFDATEPLEAVLFQAPIDNEIGWDLAIGARYRPFLNNNFVLLGGIATLLPGDGFADIYESKDALYGAFMNLTLTF